MRHIVSLSGGKDSSALAIYLNKTKPNYNMEYIFCDTGMEYPETYEYLKKLSKYLGKEIIMLNSGKGFEFYLNKFNGFLPSAARRWCTRLLKIVPSEKYIGSDSVITYIGIRADEQQRKSYVPRKKNIKAEMPFIEDNIKIDDVSKILEESGLGLPGFYKYSRRSGCFCCFFQRKIDWVRLKENHPALFDKAKSYEHGKYTFSRGETLEELSKPERIEQIKRRHQKKQSNVRSKLKTLS